MTEQFVASESTAARARPSVFTRLRALGKDPLYRGERRQVGGLATAMIALVGALAMLAPLLGVLLDSQELAVLLCLSWLLVPALPAILTAEGVLAEYSAGTVEAVLLTPAERDRFLWAKVLARGRAFFWLALASPALFALAGALIGRHEEEPPGRLAAMTLLGLGVGAAVAVFLAGEVLTAGALGAYFAVRFRSRMFIYLLCLAATGLLHLVEFFVFLFVWGLLAGAGRLLSGCLGPEQESLAYAGLAVGLAVLGLVLAARVALVNLVWPEALLAHAGCQFDRRQLRQA
jgi:MFS family permease